MQGIRNKGNDKTSVKDKLLLLSRLLCPFWGRFMQSREHSLWLRVDWMIRHLGLGLKQRVSRGCAVGVLFCSAHAMFITPHAKTSLRDLCAEYSTSANHPHRLQIDA
jgi:hypothetical protein